MTSKNKNKLKEMNRNLRDSYKKYKQTTDEVVERKIYLKINALYNKFLTRKVLEGNEVTLPARLGTLQILGKKPKIKFDENNNVIGLAPDWVATKKLWEENPEAKKRKQRVFHTNPHTDGVRYSWHWSKNKVLVENKTLYALRMTRDNKRAVHKLIKEGKQYPTKA